jgi:hypothetical protein
MQGRPGFMGGKQLGHRFAEGIAYTDYQQSSAIPGLQAERGGATSERSSWPRWRPWFFFGLIGSSHA